MTAVAPGMRIGAYQVVAKLGEGGMGEVYRATDSKLKRDVALKVLPADVANDRERLARFQREAEVLASLNHPNIAHIHGLEASNGITALVMELVEGEDLSQRIARGPIPIDEALPIAKQIAEALEAAHELGIVHRDLKPANVKVRPDGTAKVLDFGLAKAADPGTGSREPEAAAALANSPTITSPAMTQAGVILGTAAYMAPEQARGRLVDRRADIWAFGAVLYEMVTGTRPFRGDDVTDTIVAVVSKEPDWSLIPAAATVIRLLLVRCLKKDPKLRMRDIGEARLQIDELLSGAADPTTSTIPSASSRRMMPAWLGIAMASAAVIGAATLTFITTRPAPAGPAPVVRFSVPAPSYSLSRGESRSFAVSPDGKFMVFTTPAGAGLPGQLMFRAFDQAEAVAISGVTNPESPFISPDSKWVGYFEGADIKKVPVADGGPIDVFRVENGSAGTSRSATWGADDTIVFSSGRRAFGLRSVPAAGGAAKVLTTLDSLSYQVSHLSPSAVAGGRAVLYSVWPSTNDVNQQQVAVLDLATGQSKTLIRGGSQAEYLDTSTGSKPSGFVVYAVAGGLRAVRFDPLSLEVTGDPVALLDKVVIGDFGSALYDLSNTGTLAYVPGRAMGVQNAGRTVVWVDRRGTQEGLSLEPQSYASVRLSPDGTRLALDTRDRQNDIWIYEFARRIVTRLTLDPAIDGFPLWSPDSRHIFFESNRKSVNFQIYSQPADGTGAAEQLTTDAMQRWPYSITPDGRRLILHGETSSSILDVMNLDGRSKPEPLLSMPPFSVSHGDLSPDGKWLAYQSNEGGRAQIYVRPFPDVNAGRWQVSPSGGGRPVWSRNGRELFYLAGSSMMAVPVQTSTTFTAGTPAKLFEGSFVTAFGGRSFDVSLDGQRFVMIKDTPEEDRAESIAVVLNWREELKRRFAGQ